MALERKLVSARKKKVLERKMVPPRTTVLAKKTLATMKMSPQMKKPA